MIVEGRLPSRKSFTCWTMLALSWPARLGTAPRLLPSVPWQVAQLAATSRPRFASAAPAPSAATSSARPARARKSGWFTPPSPLGRERTMVLLRRVSGAAKKDGAHRAPSIDTCCSLRYRLGFLGFLEDELDLVALVDVDGHLAAADEPAEQKLVGERLADRILAEPRHRPRAHL